MSPKKLKSSNDFELRNFTIQANDDECLSSLLASNFFREQTKFENLANVMTTANQCFVVLKHRSEEYFCDASYSSFEW